MDQLSIWCDTNDIVAFLKIKYDKEHISGILNGVLLI